jgi:hypothetical protein
MADLARDNEGIYRLTRYSRKEGVYPQAARADHQRVKQTSNVVSVGLAEAQREHAVL